jgi:aminopeptidase N
VFMESYCYSLCRSSHPIQVPIVHAEEVEQVFDAISYQKGSSIVRMATAVVGFDCFRRSIGRYMTRHQYGNTDTSDLWMALREESGLDIASLLQSWTLQQGFPYVSVVSEEWTENELRLTLKQQQFLVDDDDDSSKPSSVWHIPLRVVTGNAYTSSCHACE